MQLVPFHVEHLRSFEPGERERALMQGRDMARIAQAWEGKAVALVEGEAVLGIAGMNQPQDGVGLITMALSEEIRRRPMALHRMAARYLDPVCDFFGFRRLLATVHPLDEPGIRWLERLGFGFDTALPDYAGSGVTFWRYGLDRH